MNRRAAPGWCLPAMALVAAAVFGCGGTKEADSARWTVLDIPASQTVGVRDILQYQGQEHCGWTSVTFLEVTLESGRHQYVRDPEGVLRTEPLPEPLQQIGAVPQLAVWAGWHSPRGELWLAPDASAAYVGQGDAWERWPAPPYEVGCD